MEAEIAQQRLQEDVQDIEEGNGRFRDMQQEGLGCRRACAVAAPILTFVILVAYFLLLRVLDEQALGVVE